MLLKVTILLLNNCINEIYIKLKFNLSLELLESKKRKSKRLLMFDFNKIYTFMTIVKEKSFSKGELPYAEYCRDHRPFRTGSTQAKRDSVWPLPAPSCWASPRHPWLPIPSCPPPPSRRPPRSWPRPPSAARWTASTAWRNSQSNPPASPPERHIGHP